jgi:proteasome lid subunit RPN8/RPN11
MRISAAQRDDMVQHARETAPEECCGFATVRDGVVQEVVRAENEYESRRYGYQLDSQSMFLAWRASEEDGLGIAVYHSHPRSAAEPSQADINLAGAWPGWRHFIVSLAGNEPDVRAWLIADGRVEEEDVVVE